MGAAAGPVLVVVVVAVVVVEAIIDGCCDRTVVKVLYCPVGVIRGDHCNAPSGVLGSLMWTREVMQGSDKGSRVQGEYV
jgi:hypothetical protein